MSDTTDKQAPLEEDKAQQAEASEAQSAREAQDTPEPQEEPVLSPEEALQALEAHNEALKDKYLRLMAEFDNYKKRTVKEKLDMMKNAAEDTMSALLPVLDDFDRAKKAADQNDKGDLFSEGIGLVYKKLYATLERRGLKPMDSNGAPFDPEVHEALTEIPAPTEDLKGKVVDTVEQGYWLNDRIIRHAKVVVGK